MITKTVPKNITIGDIFLFFLSFFFFMTLTLTSFFSIMTATYNLPAFALEKADSQPTTHPLCPISSSVWSHFLL